MNNDDKKFRIKDRLGDREEVWLGDIAKFYKGKDISKSDINDDGEVFCIRYGELYTKYNEIIESVSSKTNTKKKLFFSEKEDVIIPSSGETAIDIATASCVNIEGIALGGDINVIRPDLEKVKGLYLAYYLNNKKKVDIAKMVQGISVMHIYNDSLKLLKLNIPNIEEQVKVMNFLTSIDILIEKQEKLLVQLEEQKCGYMQYIFNIYLSDIEQEALRNIATISKGKQLNKLDMIEDGVYPVYNGGIELSGRINEYNEENNITISEGGNSCGNVKYINHKYWSGGHNYSLKEVKINKQYLFQFLKFSEKEIMKLRIGSGIPNIQLKELNEFLILNPSLKEQNKIASLLSSMDKLIELNEEKLEQLKFKKKYYLNEIFN